ncbi:hypothetical protein [Rivihabitans pingtungensis]|uniref:hypothetical protein n=1 Tax=Rivihabitans pingtungensis TaxID=1054498 RepID=UPI00147420F4|nr:hypothetical protein [Rivihabitans pingtungensis]
MVVAGAVGHAHARQPISERERVFERFYRILGHNEPGCGLGLAIVAECARGLDASLRLSEGAHGRGLRVEVRLAACPASG